MLYGVTLVGQLCALGQQTLTALLAATLENTPPSLGGHASPKAVLALADAFGRLICALAHDFRVVLGSEYLPGGGRLAATPHLSMRQEDFSGPKNTKNTASDPLLC